MGTGLLRLCILNVQGARVLYLIVVIRAIQEQRRNMNDCWIMKESKLPIYGPKDIADSFESLKLQVREEEFHVLTYTQKNGELGRYLISIGTLTASLVHPRECLKPAILDSAAAICFLHNHPSGSVEPSRQDKTLTTRLCESCTLMGIRVLDHIIVARDGYYSFSDSGLLSSSPNHGIMT